MDLLARAGFRSQVTKIVKESTEYLKTAESSITEDISTLENVEEDLTVYLQRLSTANENLRTINSDIRSKGLEDKNVEKIAEYDDVAIGAIARLQSRLAKIRSRLAPVNSPEINTSTIPNSKSIAGIKLPTLPLKRFSGDYQEWIPFWENFRTTIHDNSSLTGSDKFNYLQSVLSGSALKAIAGFTPSDSCYDGAISLLQEEFGDKEKLIDKNMQQLMSLPKVHQKTDAVGLRHLYNTVIASSRSLTALGVPSSHYYIMLKTILLKCMPGELRIDYHRIKKETGIPSEECKEEEDKKCSERSSETGSTFLFDGDKEVKNILRFLRQEVESIERAAVAPAGKMQVYKSAKHTQPSTAAGLFTPSYSSQCFFCKASNHTTKDCDMSEKMSIGEKKQLLKRDGRCYRCTKRGHMSKNCKVNGLECKLCRGKHATVICSKEVSSNSSTENKLSTVRSDQKTTSLLLPNRFQSISSIIFLQTARVFLFAPHKNNNLFVRIVLDGGSQRSYIRESIVSILNLPVIGVTKLNIIPFGQGNLQSSEVFRLVKVLLRSQFSDKSLEIVALVVPEICMDVLPVPDDDSCGIQTKKLRLADTNFCDREQKEGLSMLIGADFYWQVASGKCKRLTSGLTAVETIFGWTIQGPSDSSPHRPSKSSSSLCSLSVLENMWNLESIGIKDDEMEKSAHTKNLQGECIRKTATRYEASLPWRSNNLSLDDNRAVAIARLRSLHRRLTRQPTQLFEYDKLMRDFIGSGFAEPATDCSPTKTYYMPHRPVYRPDKSTTEVRIVFDASSHEEGKPSLNDCLWTGSNLLPDILEVLLKFRIGKIGLVADIEKAFLQISLAEQDRDSHRFFWYSEPIKSVTFIPSLKEFRMNRVTFGVTCSPFLLSATIQLHLSFEEHQYPETCSVLRQSFYVDDVVTSLVDVCQAKRFHQESKNILSRASMNLRKWVTNDEAVRKYLGKDNYESEQTVLGVRWNIFTDELSLNLKESDLNDISIATKRNVLKVIARIYDPLGFLGPIVIRMKILFQELWRMKLDWDVPLDSKLAREWSACIKDLDKLNELRVPRWLGFSKESISNEVHIFADASMKAFGAVAYVRIEGSQGVDVQFLCAKSRVAPLKNDKSSDLTLPKLELTAALIASRLSAYFNKIKMPFNKHFLWTDSTITLHWIKGEERRWKPYIFNRVKEIQELTDVSDWYYCSSKQNPADLLTRGISISRFCSSKNWLKGPDWLKEEWRNLPVESSDTSTTVLSAFVDSPIMNRDDEREPLLSYSDVSSWRRLLRITAYVIKAVSVFFSKKASMTKYLKAADLKNAEHYWLSRVSRFHVDEDGLLRIGTRLQQLNEPKDIANPILLPKGAYITKLIISYTHELAMHSGVNTVLAWLREKFWLPNGRQIIKKVIKSCRVCQRLRGKSCSLPFAPLPRQRLIAAKPFETVGVDFAGPFYTTDNSGRRKVYLMIFTCAVIRAVHLELVSRLTSESCLLAIRRFISRRGIPKAFFSDNAKTFKKAAGELKNIGNILECESFEGFLTNHSIDWHFSVERAPWWGGFWERLIKSVKDILKASIWKAKIGTEELETFLIEAERVINSRPLTYISDDPLDLTPITPNSFLIGQMSIAINENSTEITAKNLRISCKTRKSYISILWRRWKTEYLHLLRSAHHSHQVLSKSVKPGDVVMVYDPVLPKIHWRLAMVETCYPGRDNRIRACELKFADGKRLRRAIQLLYPLEVSTYAGPEDVKN